MIILCYDYILAEKEIALGKFISYNISLIISLVLTLLIFAFYIIKLIKTKKERTE